MEDEGAPERLLQPCRQNQSDAQIPGGRMMDPVRSSGSLSSLLFSPPSSLFAPILLLLITSSTFTSISMSTSTFTSTSLSSSTSLNVSFSPLVSSLPFGATTQVVGINLGARKIFSLLCPPWRPQQFSKNDFYVNTLLYVFFYLYGIGNEGTEITEKKYILSYHRG